MNGTNFTLLPGHGKNGLAMAATSHIRKQLFLHAAQQALPGGEHRVAAAVVAAGEPERGAVHPSVVWHDDVIGYPFGFSAALKLVSPSPASMLAPFLT